MRVGLFEASQRDSSRRCGLLARVLGADSGRRQHVDTLGDIGEECFRAVPFVTTPSAEVVNVCR